MENEQPAPVPVPVKEEEAPAAGVLPWNLAFKVWIYFFVLYATFLWLWRGGMSYIESLLGMGNFIIDKVLDFSIMQGVSALFLKWTIRTHWQPLTQAICPKAEPGAPAAKDEARDSLAADAASGVLSLRGLVGIWWSYFWRYICVAFGLSVFFNEIGYPLFIGRSNSVMLDRSVVPYYLLCLISGTLFCLKWALEARWYVFAEAMEEPEAAIAPPAAPSGS
jgi:hypothetical protein